MLFVRDKGRMCNNLLQYGHLYAWAREEQRASMSMRFAYKYPYFHINHTPYHSFPYYLIGKWGSALGLLPVISFDKPNADPAPNVENDGSIGNQDKAIETNEWICTQITVLSDAIKACSFKVREALSQPYWPTFCGFSDCTWRPGSSSF